MILVLLPLLAFAILFLSLLGAEAGQSLKPPDPRPAFLRTAILWGVLSLGLAEGLGALHALDRGGDAAGWIGVVAAVFLSQKRLGDPAIGAQAFGNLLKSQVRGKLGLPAAMIAVLFMLLVVGLAAPPNNVDSLLYHMSRTVHWAQNHSLQPYATAYTLQLFMPPWAEEAILHFGLLAGSDLFANLVQWFAAIGCVIGVSSLAARLGAGRHGQVAAAAFALSLPMTILQATSTQNDLVVAFWWVALVHQVVEMQSKPTLKDLILIGAALGLGWATKVTSSVFSIPILIWILLRVGRGFGWSTSAWALASVLAIAALMNLPHWARNQAVFGTPLGPRSYLATNQGFLLRSPLPGVVEWVAVEVQMMARNLVPPTATGRQILEQASARFPSVLGDSFVVSMDGATWNHEDTAGNPVHLLAAGLTGAGLLLLARRGLARGILPYAGAALAGYLLLPLFVVPASPLHALRYQLVFFVGWAPVAGWTLSHYLRPSWANAISLGGLILCAPWLLFNNTRPVIGWQPWVTRVGSVFQAPPQEILFAMYAGQGDEAAAAAQRIQDAGCRTVGLQIDSHDPEYVYWWLLGVPKSGVQIEHITTYPELEPYLRLNFHPCAILCTVCLDEPAVGTLSLDTSYGRLRLYLVPLVAP